MKKPSVKDNKEKMESILIEELYASELCYRSLFESTKDGILILNAETGKIIDVNPFLIDLLGYTKKEFVEKTIWEIGAFQDIYENKEKFLELQQKEYVRYDDLPLLTSDGRKIYVEFISNLYLVDNSKVIQCNIRDITERIETEAALEKTRIELAEIKIIADELNIFTENIIDTVREPLLAIDKDLRVIKASRSFYNFFKVSPEETIGKLIYELGNHQWDIPKLKELLEEIIPEKNSFDNYEVKHNFSSIGKRVMLLNARQVKRAFGKEKIILLAIEDITERKGKEDILKEKNRVTSDSLNSLLNHMHAPIIIWDTSMIIKRFNRQFELLSGYDSTEVIDKNIGLLFPKDKIATTLELLKNHLDDEQEHAEIDILTKDNNIRTVLWNSSRILDEEGKNIIATISQDITSRKLTEDALNFSETRYRRLFESAQDGILILDAETGKIVDVNPFLIYLLGYTKKEFVEKSIWEIGAFQDIYENKEKFFELQQEEYVRYDDLPLVTSDGRIIHVEFVSIVYLANNIKVIQCNIRDNTERMSIQNEIKFQADLINNVGQAVIATNLLGKVIYWNNAAEKIYGWSASEAIGESIMDLTPTLQSNEQAIDIMKILRAGKTWAGEFYVKRKDGTNFPAFVTDTPILDSNGKLTGIIGISSDISERKQIQQKINDSEKRFRAIFDQAPFAIALIDTKGNILLSNIKLSEMVGYSLDELSKMKFPDFTYPEDIDKDLKRFTDLTNGKIYSYTLEKRYIHKNGAIVWVNLSVSLLVDLSGTLIEILGMAEDITERKKAEKEITMLAHSLKSVNESVSITDLEDKIIFVNQSFVDTYGYELNELIGQPISMVRSPINEQNHVSEILPATIRGEWQGELINIRKDGSHFPVYLSTTVVKDKDNKILGLIGVATDITARKHAEEELKQSETKFRSYIENAPNGVFVTDEKGGYIDVNKSACSMLGYSEEELLNISIPDLLSEESFEDGINRFKNLQHNEVIEKCDLLLKSKNGIKKWFSLDAVKLSETRFLGFSSDVTERKQMEIDLIAAKEKAEESDRLKTAFLHNISHEIRTPMNAIVGFSGFLNDPDLTTEKRKNFTDIIIQGSDQLLSIIDDIISIATIEAGLEKIHETEININSVCKLINDQFYYKASVEEVALSLKTTLPDNEAIVITDATKLTQILNNLIGNALKFTQKGYIKFGYTLKDSQLEFFVKDTGMGIPLDMQDVIFTRFRQVETSNDQLYGGSGVGLSISKAYVELLGGKIWLDSILGTGSEFYFTIPYKKVNPKISPNIPSAKGLGSEFNINKTLLIAEDDNSNFLFLKVLLSNTGINIIRAEDGIEAVELCKSTPHIDLVLMDIKMPKMGGFEATKQIKEFRPYLPIIALTAYSTEVDRNKALACGCSDFISKPLKKEMVLSKIKEYLYG